MPGLALAVRASASAEQNSGHVLLLCQRIPTAAGPDCLTFWDHGATTALVTFDYAEKAGLEGVDCTLELTVVGDQQETLTTKIFVVPLIDRQGNQHDVCAFGMKRITSDMKALGVDQAVALFDKLQKKEVDPPTGAVDLLVGMSYVNLLPVRGPDCGETGHIHQSVWDRISVGRCERCHLHQRRERSQGPVCIPYRDKETENEATGLFRSRSCGLRCA